MPLRTAPAPRRVRSGALPWPLPIGGNNTSYARFLRAHLYVPLIALSVILATIAIKHLDWRVAHAIYSLEGNHWLLKRGFVTETLIHRLGVMSAPRRGWACSARG